MITHTLAVGRRCLRIGLAQLLTVTACFGLSVDSRADQNQGYTHAVVAADHGAASEAGLEMLRQGGNVVDAAVASSFALSVVRPASCGVGGGGFMVLWNAESQQAVTLDYRETAPAAATRDMFASSPEGEAESVRGGRAIAVPGTVAGLCFAAEQYGSLPLPTLLEPAIRLAAEGVEPDEHDRAVQRSVLKTINQHPGYRQTYEPLLQMYLNDGKAWKRGDRFHSPQLALLQLIARQGADAFYRGDVARSVCPPARPGNVPGNNDHLDATAIQRRDCADSDTWDSRTVGAADSIVAAGIRTQQRRLYPRCV